MKYIPLFFILAGCGTYTEVILRPSPSPEPSSVPCTVTLVPNGQQVSCPDGTSGIVYNGTNGTNGTIVKTVQFCPNSTPIYPTTFPEVGIVIGTSIYAVYSANDGFLTLLTPGTYYSNAIGSSCDFIVNSDGTITQD
jgi:hypothetical protein